MTSRSKMNGGRSPGRKQAGLKDISIAKFKNYLRIYRYFFIFPDVKPTDFYEK
ncbi:hypothetical protein [Tychonema sp. LEGE 06208]|uniref:hypothetical protein n=1 Tax=Tychonema sp. LEGE 06208 TaxID=1828663 RepID=UPI00187ED63E|nr:hypothetical protein [Tychonema sp. LEGE 06208]MBE9160762.1 hypothetical protein [Tychonema sp. LEGE 06208]